VERYEAWFDRYRAVYASEVEAVRALLPKGGKGLEVGVGTGRFALPLGVRLGVEPSGAMARLAIDRGIEVWSGTAEALPCNDAGFDYLLMVVTVCFLDDVYRSFCEAFRVLRPGGRILIGFIDRVSPLGRAYEKMKEENVFYREATFFSTDEVVFYLTQAGFEGFAFRQTIFRSPSEIEEPELSKEGYGEGSFVVVRGEKPCARP
jgi:SAM-dependent methyltransferase